jgi:hypothetical protein
MNYAKRKELMAWYSRVDPCGMPSLWSFLCLCGRWGGGGGANSNENISSLTQDISLLFKGVLCPTLLVFTTYFSHPSSLLNEVILMTSLLLCLLQMLRLPATTLPVLPQLCRGMEKCMYDYIYLNKKNRML